MKEPTPTRAGAPAAARSKAAARKRYVCRLPLQLASRFEALREAYPGKKRSQFLEELLRLGLAEVERAWAGASAADAAFHPDTRQPIYLPTGPFAEFHHLVQKHHLALEHEFAAADDPQAAYPVDDYALDAKE
ncbi:MAG: hypothetical protein KJ614_04090 [Gammaproteobacteria bacterium]|uniref:hypothetical protein n=1 Tax=Rhodoferax sp. TaxID=50421 RepID=UPI0017F1F803|nr:hypothetical protein [Rhodoferax sp.]MBU3898100.1 hypothetical protein [Gammaproteobacteria bacterium]MBA3056415.1 hypothetical protein [Rhodoferax sp.]MBU3999143.1 hypothetical protein [Gammaproteobacteria bacterium]MBU4081706.1 hypothetical protein [Gammaproteobacteria bacterium]MBU4114638.1 hypothetical protein [Gammaproteobacteria bacterium]